MTFPGLPRILAFIGCCLLLIGSPTTPVNAQDAAAPSVQLQQAFQQAVAAIDPSVVRIETVGGEDLVGETLTGTGPTSGCVIREDGYIITSRFNFLAKPSSIVVTLSDERKFAAEIVANDESRMLTLLKINAKGLVPLKPVAPEEVRIGQWAIAVGRTFDLKFPNVSVGIVSAVNRVWGRALQTDAKTSPLNYGGPLIDLSARCLGIIVPLSPDARGTTAGVEWYDSGIGFAVPLTDVLTVLPRLIAGETLKPGLMGIGFEDNGPVSGEAKAIRIRPESPADKAGLLVGDIIIKMNGRPIEKLGEMKQILGSLYANDVIHLTIRRDKETLEREFVLADQLKAFVAPYLGVMPDRKIPAPEATGALVREVLAKSPAAEVEIKNGDAIQKVNADAVSNSKELANRIQRIQPDQTATISILQKGASKEVSPKLIVRPSAPPDHLPPALIPQPERPTSAKIGRSNSRLPGDGLEYWLYVPENYRDDYRWGLLVWLHPNGNPMEAETMRVWSQVCRDRGIIIVGPRAPDVSGWSSEHEESIKSIIEQVMQTYEIDPARITVMGRESSGIAASQIAFKYRELVRGLILDLAPLRIRPPDVDPDFPLEIAMITSPEHAQHRQVVRTFEAIKQMNFPAWLVVQDKTDGDAFPEDVVQKIARWLDWLDRI